ncbi:MAG: 50S ribosomal protein L23 [Opitutaceae bacterium]|nr:50S ribosomal protein L23 [Opitutaceae bacterium]
MSPDKVLKGFRLTEKSNRASSEIGQYTFEVYTNSTKYTIREAIEKTFEVTVRRVNVINVKGKQTRNRRGQSSFKPGFKKALVTLKEGDKIEMI